MVDAAEPVASAFRLVVGEGVFGSGRFFDWRREVEAGDGVFDSVRDLDLLDEVMDMITWI